MSDNNEEVKVNRGGRPLSTEKLVAKIKKLEEQLVEAKSGKLDEVLATLDLTNKATSVILRDRKFELVTLGYDLKTGLAKVESVKYLGDSYSRAMFEFKKIVASKEFIQGDK